MSSRFENHDKQRQMRADMIDLTTEIRIGAVELDHERAKAMSYAALQLAATIAADLRED
jgi:hypothetical protein